MILSDVWFCKFKIVPTLYMFYHNWPIANLENGLLFKQIKFHSCYSRYF